MAEANTMFNFELVSPEAKLMSKDVHMVILPGEAGDIGVLAGHTALLSSLKPGTVRIFSERNATPEIIFISGGFADITDKSCVLLAEYAVNVGDLDADELKKKLANLQEDLQMAATDLEKDRLRSKINLTNAKLQAATGRIMAAA